MLGERTKGDTFAKGAARKEKEPLKKENTPFLVSYGVAGKENTTVHSVTNSVSQMNLSCLYDHCTAVAGMKKDIYAKMILVELMMRRGKSFVSLLLISAACPPCSDDHIGGGSGSR